jgi:SAM-dependent methyltransferase
MNNGEKFTDDLSNATTRSNLRSAAISAIRRSNLLYRLAWKLRFAWGSLLGPRSIEGIAGRVHRNDTMFQYGDPNAAESYAQVGENVVQILEETIETCGRSWSDLGKVLEVGCNYGRITRQLITKVEPARVYGCDILQEGPDFCAKEFKVNSLPPTYSEGFPKEPLFDIVFLISVFTHLSNAVIATLLKEIEKSMQPGAILMFTAHGPISAAKVQIYGPLWVDKHKEIGDALDDSGCYFKEYSYGTDMLGMSWHTEDRMLNLVREACPSLQIKNYGAARLDNHQDVYVFQKPGAATAD